MKFLIASILIVCLATFLVPASSAQETVHVCIDIQFDCGQEILCVQATGTVNAGRCVWDPCTNPNVC